MINHDVNEISLLKSLSKQSTQTTIINKAMCCLIITHPTSDIILMEMEITQLHSHSHKNTMCFGIVISPHNIIPNMICVKLTNEGLYEMNEFELKCLLSPTYCECLLSCYLAFLINIIF